MSVTVRNTNNESTTHAWTFKYNPPPVVTPFSPANNAYLTSGPPYLFSVAITDLDEDGNTVPYATLKAQFNALLALQRPRLQIDGFGTVNLTGNDATQRWEYNRLTAINLGDTGSTTRRSSSTPPPELPLPRRRGRSLSTPTADSTRADVDEPPAPQRHQHRATADLLGRRARQPAHEPDGQLDLGRSTAATASYPAEPHAAPGQPAHDRELAAAEQPLGR